MTEQDVHNYSSPISHRLPTLSATQALKNLSSSPQKPVSTGFTGLDAILQGREYDTSSQHDLPGGISRGEVTEISGPPGVGKTSFAYVHGKDPSFSIIRPLQLRHWIGNRLQIAAHAIASEGSVVWVDTSHVLYGSRLNEFNEATDRDRKAHAKSDEENGCLRNFHHFTAPTLPHLLALLTHSSDSFPPPKTSLVVIDNISTLFNLAFPKSRGETNNQQTPIEKNQAAQWAFGRRWAVMESLISDLGKLAITKNIGIVLICQMTTRIRDEARAMLYPTITGNCWESGLATRVVLFRDWLFRTPEVSSQREHELGIRFAGVTKAKNVVFEGFGRLATFRIAQHGLEEIRVDETEIRVHHSPTLPVISLKRTRAVADSESDDGEAASDQEFGWDGDAATLEAEGLVE